MLKDYIQIKTSKTADTRTSDWTKVDKETLIASSKQHIADVTKGLHLFANLLHEAAIIHDADKILEIDWFHNDFTHGFKDPEYTTWWTNHRKVNRHHLNKSDGVPEDVNLRDVLEYIVDCVMAGLGRAGEVYPLEMPNKVLQIAFENTVELLINQVEVIKED